MSSDKFPIPNKCCSISKFVSPSLLNFPYLEIISQKKMGIISQIDDEWYGTSYTWYGNSGGGKESDNNGI